jgi:sulfofructosephosphate aldolase
VLTLDALARPSGTFAMVAMDQRESLRTMLAQHHPAPIDDDRLVAFKLAVAQELAPFASGFLIDAHYALDRIAANGLLPDSCGLVVAVDALDQPPGGVVEDTELDDEADVAAFAQVGAVALKLLVVWRDDAARARRLATARLFAQLAAEHGLLSVLEGVVRSDDREAAIVEAAAELSSVGPSLYKCEVPLHGRGDPTAVEEAARAIGAAVACPWVVLSQGVDPDDFPGAVEACCRGGASGFLAGRALWTTTLGADDPSALLREASVPRLVALGAIVDRYGTPWQATRPR